MARITIEEALKKYPTVFSSHLWLLRELEKLPTAMRLKLVALTTNPLF